MSSAVVQGGGGNSTVPLSQLLLDLSSSLSSAPPRSHEPAQLRRKRRRSLLDVFFGPPKKTLLSAPTIMTTSAVTSSPFTDTGLSVAPLRQQGGSSSTDATALRVHTRQLMLNAVHNISRVSDTHAAMLEILCASITNAAQGATEATEAELMLHIILRTSVAAAPPWQCPPVAPRCWLSPIVTAAMEQSPALRRRMRWSCDPDPFVHAAIGEGAAAWPEEENDTIAGYNGGSNPRRRKDRKGRDSSLASWSVAVEDEEVQQLFARRGKENAATMPTTSRQTNSLPVTPLEEVTPSTVDAQTRNTESVASSSVSLFRPVYRATASPLCSMLFVALHRATAGLQDPYLFLQLDSDTAAPVVRLSPEFICPSASGPICLRGPLALLQWACVHGTLLARLRRLCEVAAGPEWRGALGRYGRRTIEAVAELTSVLRGAIAELADRRGGPHGVGFTELLAAQRRLRPIANDIAALAAAVGVTGEEANSDDNSNTKSGNAKHIPSSSSSVDGGVVCGNGNWEASATLARLSSASLLSRLHAHYARRVAGGFKGRGGTDVVAGLCLAVLGPLHRLLDAWLGRGELDDPYDEFFIVPSHGTTASGFHVDGSAERLPSFISLAAADKILHAGVSLRVLRAAARHVAQCERKERRRREALSEDVDAADSSAGDRLALNDALTEFVEALIGVNRPPVDPLCSDGSLSYRREFYGACNAILLSTASGEMRMEGQNRVLEDTLEFGTIELMVAGNNNALRPPNEAVFFPLTMATTGVGATSSMRSMTTMLSRTTSIWQDAVASEVQRGDAAARAEAERVRWCEALRAEYVDRVRRHETQRRVQQWRAQRLALNAERITAIAATVDELLELHAAAATTGRFVRPLSEAFQEELMLQNEQQQRRQQQQQQQQQQQRLDPSQRDRRAGLKMSRSGRVTLPPIPSALGLEQEKVDDDANEEVSAGFSLVSVFGAPTAASRRGSRSKVMAPTTFALASLQPARQVSVVASEGLRQFHHPPTMYTVADINDEEYIARRAGPHVTNTSAMDALLDAFAAKNARVSCIDISTEAYLRECTAVAVRTLCRRAKLSEHKGSQQEHEETGDKDEEKGDDQPHHSKGQGKNGCYKNDTPLQEIGNEETVVNQTCSAPETVINDIWWTDPMVDEAELSSDRTAGDALKLYDALALTERQAKNLLHCASYYHDLGRYTASYLTHKALQVMLLGPHGTLFRLTQQLLDVCLMQKGRIADRLTSLWQRLTMTAMEENEFSAAVVFNALNNTFVEEWTACVPQGQDTLKVQLALLPNEDNHDESIESDGGGGGRRKRIEKRDGGGYLDTSEECVETIDELAGGGQRRLFYETAYRRRSSRRETIPIGHNLNKSIDGNEEEEDPRRSAEKDFKGIENDVEVSSIITEESLPDNPFDFTSRLTIVYENHCGGFWVLPRHAMGTYGDLFGTLLFWTSVTQLVTRVWRVGIQSGLPEAFFFCNVSRSVLTAVAQHMWLLLAGHATAYRESIRLESGLLYTHRQLESFTADHAAFLAECRFAAMLDPCFAPSRRQVYGMVRQLEEVEQCLQNLHNAASRSQSPETAPKERRRKRPTTPARPRLPPSNVKSKTKVKPTLVEAPRTRAVRLEKEMETQRRHARDTVRRRLRSLIGLTEIFVEHLTAVRDDLGSGEDEVAEETMEGGVEGTRRRNAARAAALTSLIHTLAMTQLAVKDKL